MKSVGHRVGVALALAVLLGALALASSATPVASAAPCGEQVVEDWRDNGRIDGLYELHCYEDAIAAIPSEIRDYTDAEDVIRQAYLSAGGGNRPPAPPTDTPPGDDQPPVATPDVDTSSTSDVPFPVLVLGALALALLAAGALGYVSRRRSGDGEDAPPGAG
jgi:hypothetical protein